VATVQFAPIWTVAYTEPGDDTVVVAAFGAHDRDDALRRAHDVLGGVTVVWAEPRAVVSAA
jgi:hypothetical protein